MNQIKRELFSERVYCPICGDRTIDNLPFGTVETYCFIPKRHHCMNCDRRFTREQLDTYDEVVAMASLKENLKQQAIDIASIRLDLFKLACLMEKYDNINT